MTGAARTCCVRTATLSSTTPKRTRPAPTCSFASGWMIAALRLDSALIVSDDEAGYRTFLGADPQGTAGLAAKCDQRIRLAESYIMSPAVAGLVPQVARRHQPAPDAVGGAQTDLQEGQVIGEPIQSPAFQEFRFADSPFEVPDPFRFYPQMLRWTAKEIHRLITEEGVAGQHRRDGALCQRRAAL